MEILAGLSETLARNLLRYAVGRAIVCVCGRILDARTSVAYKLVTSLRESERVSCVDCYNGAQETALVTGARITEVYDGRSLFANASGGSPRPIARKPRVKRNPPAIGETWEARVSGRLVSVRITADVSRDRWGSGHTSKRYRVTNLATGRVLDVHRNRLRVRVS